MRSKEKSQDNVQLHSSVDVGDGVLDGLVAATVSREEQGFPVAFNRSVHIERTTDGDRLRIQSPDDVVELEVLITANGPVLRFRSADLELQATKSVNIECDNYLVNATSSIRHETGGDLSMTAKDNLVIEGKISTLRATRGDVEIKANDDVRVKGERIRLNC
jgi:hypothetical protein